MPKTKLRGIDIAYDVIGQGTPLILIQGFTCSRKQWFGFDQCFDGFQVITFDNRGVGESSAPDGPYSIRELAEDTLALLDFLKIERAHVLGASMGGMIAQELAIRFPERVRALVLGCTHHGGSSQIFPTAHCMNLLDMVGKSVEQIARDRLEALLHPAYKSSSPEKAENLVAFWMRERMSQAGFWGQLGAITRHNTLSRLGHVIAPTLVMTGESDELIPPGNSQLVAAAIPGARLRTFPRAGHYFWVEVQKDAAEAARSFLLEAH